MNASVGEADTDRRGDPAGGEGVGDRLLHRVPQRRVDLRLGRRLFEDDLDADLVVDVAERLAKMFFDVRMGLPGQGADVDIDVDDIGDDVRLGLAGDHVRRERGVGAGVPVPDRGRGRQGRKRLVDGALVEQHRPQLRVEAHGVDLGSPVLMKRRRRVVLGDPLHDRRCLHHRIVGAIRARAVAWRAAHPEATPGDALLAHDHGDGWVLFAPDVETAVFGKEVIGRDGVGMVLTHPAGPVRAPGLFIGDGEEDEVAREAGAGSGDRPGDDRHRGGEVEHVDGTAAPDLVVDHLAAEGILVPAVGADRYDIGVAVETQTRRVGIGPLDPGDERRPPRGGVVLLHLDAGPLEIGGENIGVADLLARIHVPVVHAGVADQGLEQFDGFVTTRLGHDVSLADARVAFAVRRPDTNANRSWRPPVVC